MNVIKAIRGLWRRVLSIFNGAKPKKPLWNLKPEVEAAFRAAWAPVQRRKTPSVMGSTSKGAGWWPRRGRWLVKQPSEAEKLSGMKPVTYKRALPKRDKTVSAREWKRMRMAACRCTA